MLKSFFINIENNKILCAIKNGMVLAIPVIMTGSIALLILSFPVNAYQSFIATIFNGAIVDIFSFLNCATLEIISLIVLLSISYSYGKICNSKYKFIVPIVSLCSFLAFTGAENLNGNLDIFKVNWIFTSIVISVISSILFLKLAESKFTGVKYHTEGADIDFNIVISAIIPFLIVVLIFSLLNMILIRVLGEVNFQVVFLNIATKLFNNMGRNLLSALLFIFIMHLMWFLGIHGGNVLDNVAKEIFESGMMLNNSLVNIGQVPTEIFTKTFFDTMVLLGGCGTLLCLVIAIFISEKRRNVKSLAKVAVVPALFNINEILMFGIPVVLNPILFVPFLLTPIILTLTSYIAMNTGLVPYTVSNVEWTTPIFFSGYIATGSLRGSLLQLFNLILGVVIYIPFVKISQYRHLSIFRSNIDKLVDIVKEYENIGETPNLLSMNGKIGSVSNMLAADLKHALHNNEIELFYQPQVNYNGEILGAESLLRWNHSSGGYIYPPLTIALAKEANILDELGDYIIDKACKSLRIIKDTYMKPMKISVNISPYQLNNPNLSINIKKMVERYNIDPNMLGIEITEQATLSSSKIIMDRIISIRDIGVKLIMDDFGMGHSSLVHLKSNDFDTVKLDGSLVKEVIINDRSSDIIKSIVHLSNSLKFDIIVEFVETIEQKEKLNSLGCKVYQGYLYSKAITFDEFMIYLKEH